MGVSDPCFRYRLHGLIRLVMSTAFTVLLSGIREPFKRKSYLALFFLVAFFMMALFTLIPVFTVVGDTVGIQLTIFTLLDWLIVIGLSFLYALFITMQVYVIRRRKKVTGVGAVVGSGAGAVFAGVAGTAFCASCLVPLFALFGIGFGAAIFVLEYRFYFVVVIIALMLAAIYLTARKIQSGCNNC